MNEKKIHSKFGIVSTIIAVLTWIYFIALTLITVNTDYFSILFDRYIATKQGGMVEGFGNFGTAILVLLILFVAIPVTIHFIGIILGLFGAFSKKRNRLFGIIGLFANLIPFLFLLGFFLIDLLNN